MKLKEVKKGDWIINAEVQGAKKWLVVCKYAGMAVIRRGPKRGKLTALTARQLCGFKKFDG